MLRSSKWRSSVWIIPYTFLILPVRGTYPADTIFIPRILTEWKTLVTPKCKILHFLHTIFHIAPTCFALIISPSWGRWNQDLFVTHNNNFFCCFKEILKHTAINFNSLRFNKCWCQLPWRWSDNKLETCRSSLKDSMQTL